MKLWISSWLLGAFAAGVMISASYGSANAGTRAACGVLSLAEVRGLARSPVSVLKAGSSSPTTFPDTTTISSCTYVVMNASGQGIAGRTARIHLIWAPAAKLAQTSQFYAKRHEQASGMKGSVLVTVAVRNDNNIIDQSASQQLLAAVLQKL